MTTPKGRPSAMDSPFFAPVSRYLGRAHTWIYRRTDGRFGGTLRVGAGFRKPVPTLLLEHRGRISGKLFTTPLLYIADGGNVVIVASALGHADNPQWYRNLLAYPDIHIQIGSERRAVTAIVASADERARLWSRLVEAYKDFDSYQGWTEREIPVVVLHPR